MRVQVTPRQVLDESATRRSADGVRSECESMCSQPSEDAVGLQPALGAQTQSVSVLAPPPGGWLSVSKWTWTSHSPTEAVGRPDLARVQPSE